MILCVDIGNTAIKLARVRNTRAGRLHVIPTQSSAREIERAVERVLRDGADGAAISSVRPDLTSLLAHAIRARTGTAPLVVTHRVVLPIQITTRRPARVGVDRICAASGAVLGRTRHAIIVDVGSAITVDLVLARRFVGGLIMPGPQMMLTALHQFTAQLPDLRIDEAGRGRVDDTAPAMLTGAVVGSAGAVEAAVRLLARRSARAPQVWLTGGHAARLRKEFPKTWRYEPHLTLLGLASIARLNQIGR